MSTVNSLGGIYKFGTISITAGDTVFTGTSTLWTQAAEQGDWILAGGQVAIINATITDTQLNAETAWTGSTLVNAPYVLIKMSWLRYEPAILQQKVRELLASLAASGMFLFVEGDEPNPTEGDNGSWAIKVNDGSWRLWYKVDDVWVLQGTPVGIDFADPFPYDPATSYLIGKVVLYKGKWFKSRITPNLGNTPDTSPTQWTLILANGERYDSQNFDTDRPASDELIDKWLAPTQTTFYAGLVESAAHAEVGATNTAVYRLFKNGVQFATITFAAGGQGGPQLGVVACPTTTVLDPKDIYTVKAPITRDPTLSGVAHTIVAYRNN